MVAVFGVANLAQHLLRGRLRALGQRVEDVGDLVEPVALVAGLMWGARNGVQYALTFIALKALPVLILGGFESVAGAIVGGLIIGASEKLAEVYLGPFVGGGLESWFPYVLALSFLLVRPEGLFGEKHIDRV